MRQQMNTHHGSCLKTVESLFSTTTSTVAKIRSRDRTVENNSKENKLSK